MITLILQNINIAYDAKLKKYFHFKESDYLIIELIRFYELKDYPLTKKAISDILGIDYNKVIGITTKLNKMEILEYSENLGHKTVVTTQYFKTKIEKFYRSLK